MADAPEPAVTAQPSVAADPTAVERRIVSVLFADLVGFTPLSERLDPEDVATIQDAYFSATRETIARYGGTVEKFIGDAVMAVFGAPRARDDDAVRAVRAGLALIGAVEQLNARLGLEPDALRLRVGVNTGEVVHAVAGTDAGRVTGDTVNTAARLQSAARPGSVLLGELTALSVADAVDTIDVGRVELKGKADPVRAREVVGLRSAPSREEALGAMRAPTLGRAEELARLLAAVERVRAEGAASRLLVVAPPGVGKSRLLAELAETTDAAVLRARVRPQATAPYETVAQLFGGVTADALAAALTRVGTPAARARVLVAEIGRLREPSVDREAGGDLAAERDSRFEAWLEAIEAVVERPAVWLVEDVHWAGPDLLAFLDRAGTGASGHGRLVVTTARPSLLESAPEWCRSDRTDRMELAPLAPTDAAALVRALVGDVLPASLVEAVVDRSDGTPLFIEELIRTWASVGTLVAGPDGWRLAVPPDEVLLPPTVQAIYAAQLDDLPPAARLVARRGSVAGRRVPAEALASLELGGALDGLEVLRRRAFLAGPLPDDVLGDAYAYRHALLRDAGYASLARAERSRLHAAMARWLEEVAGERGDVVAEAIAEHWAAALDSLPGLAGGTDLPDRATLARSAAHWSERAAAAALALSAHEAARRLLERAIGLTGEADALDLARRRLALGRVLAESADLDAGIGLIAAALDGYAAALPAASAGYAEAAYALARGHMQQIGFPEAGEVTASALATLNDSGAEEPGWRARLMALHAWAVSALGRREGVLEEARAAQELAASVGDRSLELDVLEHVTAARGEVGEHDPSTWHDMARRADELGRWHQAVVAMRNAALADADGHPARALPGMVAAAELAHAHGLTEQRGWCELGRCEIAFVTGDWDDALQTGRLALELAERYAYVRLGFRTWMVVLPILAARRDPGMLHRHDAWWEQAQHHFPANPSPYGAFLSAAVPVWCAQALGIDPPLPNPAVAELEVTFSNPHFRAAVESAVDAWIRGGRTDLARRLVERGIDEDATPLMRASDALLRALLAAADGDPDAQAAHARTAVEHAREIGARWWLARGLRLLGDRGADRVEAELGIGR